MNILESYHRTKETLLTWKLFFTEKMGNYVLEFCTVFSTKRLVKHIVTNNNLINTSVQKGCMDKVPGCWEHMSKVWSALKEARSTKSSFANIWLDIANAYWSIPHRLLFFVVMVLTPIGFLLSEYTIQEFIAVHFLSQPQVVGISISREFLLDVLCQ